jgi:hypothetical protein
MFQFVISVACLRGASAAVAFVNQHSAQTRYRFEKGPVDSDTLRAIVSIPAPEISGSWQGTLGAGVEENNGEGERRKAGQNKLTGILMDTAFLSAREEFLMPLCV